MQAGLFNGTTGIGVFAAAIGAADVSSEAREAAEECEHTAICDLQQMAEQAVNKLPLLYRDHLCCGNSAVAESGQKDIIK